jgi:DNA polymerase III epsilon subunit-like protein
MLTLIFDTETTGLPTKRHLSVNDLADWPHIVQLSYVIFNTETQRIEKLVDNIVKMPEGVCIPDDSIKIHRITNEESQLNGKRVADLLEEFARDLDNVEHIIGHNIAFDVNMINAEIMRQYDHNEIFYMELLNKMRTKPKFCTMRHGGAICRITRIDSRGNTYMKPPRLAELHKTLFDQVVGFENLHNSMIDVLVCLRCYYKMTHFVDVLHPHTNQELIAVYRSYELVA